MRSAECITREARWLHDRFDISFLAFLDDNFLVSPGRIEDLVKPLGNFCRDKGVRWGTHGRLDEAADLRPTKDGGSVGAARRRVDAMAEAGCIYIGFGAESANPRVLIEMKKGGHMLVNGTEKVGGRDLPLTMLHGYKNTIRAGIHGNCTWIEGYVSEDLNALKDSIAFIQWQRELVGNSESVNSRFFRATAYPGTSFFSHPQVRARLSRGFGISFDAAGNAVCDDALLEYVLQLDDADKILVDKNGDKVYYGEMTQAMADKTRELLDAQELEKVLAL